MVRSALTRLILSIKGYIHPGMVSITLLRLLTGGVLAKSFLIAYKFWRSFGFHVADGKD